LLADGRVDAATIEHADLDGWKPLMRACSYNHKHMVSILISNPKTGFENIVEALDSSCDYNANEDNHVIASMLTTELTHRQMCVIYPSKQRSLRPHASLRARPTGTATVTVAAARQRLSDATEIQSDYGPGSASGPGPGAALLTSFFSSPLFDVNVLRIIREYAFFTESHRHSLSLS
jgi:hypothetical protein